MVFEHKDTWETITNAIVDGNTDEAKHWWKEVDNFKKGMPSI